MRGYANSTTTQIVYITNSIYSMIYYSVVQYKYTTMKEYIRLRVSTEDKQLIQQEAKKERLTLSSYIRNRLLRDYVQK